MQITKTSPLSSLGHLIETAEPSRGARQERFRRTVALLNVVVAGAFGLSVSACGHWNGDDSRSATVGGTVSGLDAGQTVELSLNGSLDTITVTSDQGFAFPIDPGEAYSIAVVSHPAGKICSVANGSGVRSSDADVTNINVACSTTTYTVSGTIIGLAGGQQITLMNNNGDPLLVGADGAFTFPTRIPFGGSYAVTIGSQPVGTLCSVDRGDGADVSTSITSVAISCVVQGSGGDN